MDKPDINYIMIKSLPENAKIFLIQFYNAILQGRTLPGQWKKYNIFCFPEPLKDKNLSENYRPISTLGSCLLKTLEIMGKNRLDWLIEKGNTLSNFQIGFRKGRGIMDNISSLTYFIHNSFISGETSLAVFLDINSAYDNVNIFKLYDKLKQINIPVYLNNVIFKIFNNRLIYSRG